MSMVRLRQRWLFTLAFFTPSLLYAAPPVLELTYDPKLGKNTFTGRVLFFFSQAEPDERSTSYSWVDKDPLFSAEVRDWKAGESITVREVKGYPYKFKDLPQGSYHVRAVMHTNIELPHSGTAPGNFQSPWIEVEVPGTVVKIPPGEKVPNRKIKISIDERVPEKKERRLDERTRAVKMRSECLSKFHGRDVFLKALVVVSEKYESKKQWRFPAIYIVPGFGGDEFASKSFARLLGKGEVPFVYVCLDATAPTGHSVFADSDNNGPWGKALTEEFIPYLEKEFRLIPEVWARFVSGHSSGGWSSLWLQVRYPDAFGGCWAGSPDSMDFHDFCGINLYDSDANVYRDAEGNRRPIIRSGDRVSLTFEEFARLEDVMGPGGQIGSFEAVFGSRGVDGQPKPFFDRETGAVDPVTMESWKRYDIVDYLKRNWTSLAPKLKGKIHVVMGAKDNFYLEGATRRLKKALRKLHADAKIAVVPDCDHSSIVMSEPYRVMIDEMDKMFLQSQKESANNTEPAAAANP